MPLQQIDSFLGAPKKLSSPSQTTKALLLQAIEIPMKAGTSAKKKDNIFFPITLPDLSLLISSSISADKASFLYQKKHNRLVNSATKNKKTLEVKGQRLEAILPPTLRPPTSNPQPFIPFFPHMILNSFPGKRTLRTGHGARRTTFSAVLPNKTWSRPVRPWVPTITRSASFSSAVRRISRNGVP